MNEEPLTAAQLEIVTTKTIGHYDASAERFWAGTRDHDVSQNYAAFLGALEKPAPCRLLDLGCGPGRDIAHFKSLGHVPVGLDGAARFVEMARKHTGCEVLHQDFLSLDLPAESFDGIFANASLFHVPRSQLPRVLRQLHDALVPRGVFFASNPRGNDTEGWNGDRYGAYLTYETWRDVVVAAGFTALHHYYRPEGKPRAEQPWLASVWRKGAPVST